MLFVYFSLNETQRDTINHISMLKKSSFSRFITGLSRRIWQPSKHHYRDLNVRTADAISMLGNPFTIPIRFYIAQFGDAWPKVVEKACSSERESHFLFTVASLYLFWKFWTRFESRWADNTHNFIGKGMKIEIEKLPMKKYIIATVFFAFLELRVRIPSTFY